MLDWYKYIWVFHAVNIFFIINITWNTSVYCLKMDFFVIITFVTTGVCGIVNIARNRKFYRIKGNKINICNCMYYTEFDFHTFIFCLPRVIGLQSVHPETNFVVLTKVIFWQSVWLDIFCCPVLTRVICLQPIVYNYNVF